jgi:hypothetical protein
MRFARLSALLLLASSAHATTKEPDAACLVLAQSGSDPLPVVTSRDGKELRLSVHVDCKDLDATTSPIHVDRVDVSYSVPGDRTAATPRPSRQSLHGTCTGDGLDLDVVILTPDQKRRPPLRDLTAPVQLDALLTFHARQDGGRHRRCFGTMHWTFEVQPGR